MISVYKCNKNDGINAGQSYLYEFYNDCSTQSDNIRNRDYHEGLNSLLNIRTENTVYVNGVLTKAEGLSPRWMLLR